MGVDIDAAEFLRSEKRRGTAFAHTLTLGHQTVYMSRKRYAQHLSYLQMTLENHEYADDLFRGLGAARVDVMDASPYEGANVIHNLSEEIGASLAEKFDCVFDGGTLEHVFNFPTALKNCMGMV